jgi:hypothetical protein
MPSDSIHFHLSYNTDTWTWNTHGSDWIYPEGPEPTGLHDPTYNALGDIDDSPVSWHITEPVNLEGVDPWLGAIGGGIY